MAYYSRGIQDIIVTLFSRAGIMLIGLAMQSILAWTLGADGRGAYAICLIFSTLSAVILALGVDWSINYHIATKKHSINQLLSLSILYFIFCTCVALMLLPFIVDLKIELFNKAPKQAFELAVYWALSNIAFSMSTSILAGMREFKTLAMVVVAKAVCTLIGTFLLFNTTSLYVGAPILADVISGFGVMFFIVLFLVRRHDYYWQWPKFSLIQKVGSYALRFFGGSFGMIANAHIGTILVSFYVASQELGYFAQAMAFLAQLITLADVIARVIQPRIASSEDGRPELVFLSVRMVGMLVLLVGTALTLSASLWVPILFSSEFMPVIPLLVILMPGIWLRVIGKTLYPYFNGINRPEVITISTAINILVNLTLLIILLEPYGLRGAAWATSISYGVSTSYVVYLYLKNRQETLRDIFIPRRRDVTILIDKFRHQQKRQTTTQHTQ